MVEFTQWTEAFIFAAIFSAIIIIPCVVIALLGRNVIDKLGNFPSKTPAIQMKLLVPLFLVEIVTFAALLGFYLFFSN